MGWTESPSFFCGASEMTRDVATSIMYLNNELKALPPPFHPLEKYGKYPGAQNTGPMLLSTKPDKDWVNLEVYLDEFLVQTQRVEAIKQITRAILCHSMDIKIITIH
jgi:hypothetical protein